MPATIAELTPLPEPQYVMSAEGHRIATYTWGDLSDPAVVCVHGFASSAKDNWVATGWVRDLLRAGYRVLAIDQRGHGNSEKPHDPAEYTAKAFASDVEIAMDTYLIDEAHYVGYSLGARIGWEVAQDLSYRIEKVVLGGVPDGIPLSRLDIAQVHAYVENGVPVTDPTTLPYVKLTERVAGNDLHALLAVAEGLRRTHAVDPDTSRCPQQPVLFATGTKDAIIEGSRELAAACPQGVFVEIPDRHHFNAPGSRVFRAAALEFLAA